MALATPRRCLPAAGRRVEPRRPLSPRPGRPGGPTGGHRVREVSADSPCGQSWYSLPTSREALPLAPSFAPSPPICSTLPSTPIRSLMVAPLAFAAAERQLTPGQMSCPIGQPPCYALPCPVVPCRALVGPCRRAAAASGRGGFGARRRSAPERAPGPAPGPAARTGRLISHISSRQGAGHARAGAVAWGGWRPLGGARASPATAADARTRRPTLGFSARARPPRVHAPDPRRCRPGIRSVTGGADIPAWSGSQARGYERGAWGYEHTGLRRHGPVALAGRSQVRGLSTGRGSVHRGRGSVR